MEIALSIGSNLGDRLANLRAARRMIVKLRGVEIVEESGVYETEPVLVPRRFKNMNFLNAVLIIETDLAPARLGMLLAKIEQDIGRPAGRGRNEPRVIDIDIIYAGNLRVRSRRLTIPHPRWAVRRFVVAPLEEIRPDAVLPGKRFSVKKVLLSLPARPKVVVFRQRW